jgi:hypothetical protein
MYGGLKKSASRLALVAAAGVLSTSAIAADLGGDCCADLEERVAELEATTARKGNRKVSLTVYGWVNKAIIHWDDGRRSNTYLGQDNTNSATRFGFRGDAKVSPTVKAGYSILLDLASGARTATSNQLAEEAAGSSGFGDDPVVRVRDSNVWLESSQLGRVTLGRLTVSGPQGTIDLGNIGNVGSGSQSLVGGGFAFRAAGALTPSTIANVSDNLADYNARVDGIKYDSPTFAGFVFGASIGEALNVERTSVDAAATNVGYLYAVNLRYAGEFSGVRLAAAVGYEVSDGEETYASTGLRPNSKNLGFSLSLLHAPTGLFAQGHWVRHDRGNDDATTDRATNWLVQAGISQNWFGIGKTALYGEYSKVTNGFQTFANRAALVVGDETTYTMWGLGLTQDIDAAAMQLYLGYRNHQLENQVNTPFNDIGIITAGARINF